MRHSFKYWLALTGVVSLFLFFCPTFASAQKQFEYLSKVKKLSSATIKFKLPKFPHYVPLVSLPPLPPTNSGTLLGTPAQQVMKFTHQSDILLSLPTPLLSVSGFMFDKPESNHHIQNNLIEHHDNAGTILPDNSLNNEPSSSISVPINENDWWLEYIGRIIDEQRIRLGIEKMEKQLFKNGIKIDTEIEEDTVGFIIYSYEYKLDAA